MTEGAVSILTRRSAYGDALEEGERSIPIEAPVAIEINGVVYAVMMATPTDLDDFITGFILSEGLAQADEIGPVSISAVAGGEGFVARVNLPADRAEPIMERARRRLGDSSCGLCGVESIEAALRPLPKLATSSTVTPQAIRKALAALRDAQPLNALTSATHAAAFARADGALVVVREDVGRHNALDKLIGALSRAGENAAQGFIVMTSRCSYELVEKAVRARCPLLVTISAPTDLAVRRAEAAGLALAVVARDDTMLWVTGPHMEAAHGL